MHLASCPATLVCEWRLTSEQQALQRYMAQQVTKGSKGTMCRNSTPEITRLITVHNAPWSPSYFHHL